MAKYTAKQIKDWDVFRNSTLGYKPARSLNHTCDTYLDRLKFALGVLIGKYDVLDWEEY